MEQGRGKGRVLPKASSSSFLGLSSVRCSHLPARASIPSLGPHSLTLLQGFCFSCRPRTSGLLLPGTTHSVYAPSPRHTMELYSGGCHPGPATQRASWPHSQSHQCSGQCCQLHQPPCSAETLVLAQEVFPDFQPHFLVAFPTSLPLEMPT